MQDIHSVLSAHKAKNNPKSPEAYRRIPIATTSEIPDLFFDEILIENKLNRNDINVLMYLYRQVWCKPNLNRQHGIGPIHSYQDMCKMLHVTQEDLMISIRNLEAKNFIQTIRAGQYFVRRYFSEANDYKYGMNYDDFL